MAVLNTRGSCVITAAIYQIEKMADSVRTFLRGQIRAGRGVDAARDVAPEYHQFLLTEAVYFGDTALAEFMLLWDEDGTADPSAPGDDMLATDLFAQAVKRGHVHIVRLLLEDGRLSRGSRQNPALLHCATWSWHPDVVELLLDNPQIQITPAMVGDALKLVDEVRGKKTHAPWWYPATACDLGDDEIYARIRGALEAWQRDNARQDG